MKKISNTKYEIDFYTGYGVYIKYINQLPQGIGWLHYNRVY